MFDIGWSELLVIAVVLIVVVGPKDLPPMIRAFGKTMAGLRKMAGDFRTQFDEALKEADMDDVRQTISDVRNLNPTNSLRDAMNPLRQLGNEIKSDLQKATAAPDGLSSTPAPATSEPVAPLVSVPEPEMKLPDAPPVVAAGGRAMGLSHRRGSFLRHPCRGEGAEEAVARGAGSSCDYRISSTGDTRRNRGNPRCSDLARHA